MKEQKEIESELTQEEKKLIEALKEHGWKICWRGYVEDADDDRDWFEGRTEVLLYKNGI